MNRPKQFRIPLLLLGVCLLGGCSIGQSKVSLTGGSGKKVTLRALCAEAGEGLLEGVSSTAWFSFNPDKAGIPPSSRERGGRGGIEVTVAVESAAPVRVSLGLVSGKDLTARGRLVDAPESRPLSVVTSCTGEIRVGMLFPDSGGLADVRGFAVSLAGSPDSRARIVSASVVPAETGWEKSPLSFSAAFASSGGTIDCANPASSSVSVAPGSLLSLSFGGSADGTGTIQHQNRVTFSSGGKEFGFRKAPLPYRTYVPGALVAKSPAGVTPVSGAETLSGLREIYNAPFALTSGRTAADGASPIPAPILADPHMIIEWPQSVWRRSDREVFAWDRFPSIIIFDTADYAVQDRLFKRLAFFAEKQGYRGKLVGDAELAGLHAYNAHDYRAESLASFFEAARAADFPLNADELELRGILEAEGIIRKEKKSWVAGAGAVLSFSRESVEYQRYLFMAHEGFHGIYFIDPDFRAKVSEVYRSMDGRAVAFLETYFRVVDSLGYDTGDEYLMQNEFMGYLMQLPEDRVAAYFTENIMERYLRYGGEPSLAAYIRSTDAAEFTRAAAELGEYAFGRWGIAGGRVGLYFFY